MVLLFLLSLSLLFFSFHFSSVSPLFLQPFSSNLSLSRSFLRIFVSWYISFSLYFSFSPFSCFLVFFYSLLLAFLFFLLVSLQFSFSSSLLRFSLLLFFFSTSLHFFFPRYFVLFFSFFFNPPRLSVYSLHSSFPSLPFFVYFFSLFLFLFFFPLISSFQSSKFSSSFSLSPSTSDPPFSLRINFLSSFPSLSLFIPLFLLPVFHFCSFFHSLYQCFIFILLSLHLSTYSLLPLFLLSFFHSLHQFSLFILLSLYLHLSPSLLPLLPHFLPSAKLEEIKKKEWNILHRPGIRRMSLSSITTSISREFDPTSRVLGR